MNHLAKNEFADRPRCIGLFGHLRLAAALSLASTSPIAAQQVSAAEEPLVLEKAITIPNLPIWPYTDHMAVDPAGGRLFSTPQALKSVAVLDLKDGHVVKMIGGFGNPHSIHYSATLKRLFVTDSKGDSLKVFSSDDYALIKTIDIKGADGMAVDSHTQLIYVMGGGDENGMDHSVVTVVDPTRMEKVADIPIQTAGLENGIVDPAKGMLYLSFSRPTLRPGVQDNDEHAIGVVDLQNRQVAATWNLPPAEHSPFTLAVDSAHSRLYVACRDNLNTSSMQGTLFVLDTTNGKPVASLPTGGWVDDVSIDEKRQRIYATNGIGYIDTYSIGPNDVYHRLASVRSDVLAKTSLYSSELDRLYVSMPYLGETPGGIRVFKPSP
jgi:DNA-binding beta-propeller fold protein YncE